MVLSRASMIRICRANDGRYDGQFFMAVTSTGIYCLPSCPARFPKEKHIRFFLTSDKAEQAGYRGCQRCHAAEYRYQPAWLSDLVTYLTDSIDQKLTMADLEKVTGKSSSTIRTYFSDHYGLTPIAYHRQLRLDTARSRILGGKDYRDVAYALGYTSLSGFRSAFKAQFQTTPGQITEAQSS